LKTHLEIHDAPASRPVRYRRTAEHETSFGVWYLEGLIRVHDTLGTVEVIE
jgi:hypothetical protein